MTVSIAWMRKVHNCEELIFLSDSRLSGGHRWDQCPKIMSFPRADCCLSFAGSTDYAYPMMMQVNYAMSSYRRIRTRAMDIADLNGIILRHINNLNDAVHNKIICGEDDAVGNEFLFGGYSWVEKKFKIWSYTYTPSQKKYIAAGKTKRILKSINSDIRIIGDKREDYKIVLRQLLTDKYGDNLPEHLDMEPFEALCIMLQNVTPADSIGGAPQMIKIYQYQNCAPVGVYWPEMMPNMPKKNRTLLGRNMLDFEDTDLWFIDPKTCITHHCPISVSQENISECDLSN